MRRVDLAFRCFSIENPKNMAIDTSKPYDFVVTGASGNIGRRLIPILAGQGRRILALGRDDAALSAIFADCNTVDTACYADLNGQDAARDADLNGQAMGDTWVHLAVLNNNQSGSLDDFVRVNVDFSATICRQFNNMGGRRFVNLASVHALDLGNASAYATSKRQAEQAMREIVGEKLDNIHIGYFYDHGFFGDRFKCLRKFGALGGAMFHGIKPLAPTTSARSLADYLLGDPASAVPAILTEDLSRSLIYRAITRSMDILVAVAILLFLSPLLIALWVAIRLDSAGPAIFAQKRVGEGQKLFTLYKYRTMKQGTAAAGTHEVSVSAVTKIGKFLRGTKLDELPQAVNLLRGEMTLVGPRPCLPVQSELLEAREKLGVYRVRPGITGYAQVREIDMSRPQELAQSDYIYTKLQSLMLNFKIILQTAFGHGRGDRVASQDKP